MTKTPSTPGPCSGRSAYPTDIVDANGKWVATALAPYRDLFALAPEMAEALQQVVQSLSGANALSYDDIESADVELLLEDIKSAHAVARMILSRLPKGE